MGRPKGPCNERELAARRANAKAPGPGRPPARWHGAELAALRADYESGRLLKHIAYAYGTSIGTVCKLARLHSWALRVSLETQSNMTAARRARMA